MNRAQFIYMIKDCENALCNDYDFKYALVRNIMSSDEMPLYRFNLTIVSKVNNVTTDFCHFVAKDDNVTGVIAQSIAYLQYNDDVPYSVRDYVNLYIAGFTCAGGVL